MSAIAILIEPERRSSIRLVADQMYEPTGDVLEDLRAVHALFQMLCGLIKNYRFHLMMAEREEPFVGPHDVAWCQQARISVVEEAAPQSRQATVLAREHGIHEIVAWRYDRDELFTARVKVWVSSAPDIPGDRLVRTYRLAPNPQFTDHIAGATGTDVEAALSGNRWFLETT